MTAEILGLGEPLIEMVRLSNPIEGRPAYMQGFGGDTSTAIIAAARQGGSTGYISAVGDDMFGTALRELWAQEGVDDAHVLAGPGDPTGVCFIDPDPSGRKFTYARRGSAASLYSAKDLPEEAIAKAKVLHLSGISLAISAAMRAAGLAAVKLAKSNETLVSYDLNHRPALWSAKQALEALASMVTAPDIVFASDDEAALLFGDRSPEAVADRFLAMGTRIVIAKQGDKGALLALEDKRILIAPAPSRPVDASGAGDSFAGAFLAWFVETGDPEIAAQKASVVAAGTVSGLGAVEPIPRRERHD
ncbi:MAG: sugar kinase [Pseudomonadota bacterium]